MIKRCNRRLNIVKAFMKNKYCKYTYPIRFNFTIETHENLFKVVYIDNLAWKNKTLATYTLFFVIICDGIFNCGVEIEVKKKS